MSEVPQYALYAIRYATRTARRRDHFIGGDPHDDAMSMDYFLWTAVGADRTYVIDCGFTKEVATRRGRTFLNDPIATLRRIGIEPDAVEDVVLTHLHYDHVGNFHGFPVACFHLQEPDLHYAVGRYMKYPRLSHSFEVEDICGMVRLNYAQRVVFYNGSSELAPGIRLHAVGGHSAGLQFVTVNTARGTVVLASDASHFYENLESMRPFPTLLHVGEVLEGFDRLLAEAPSRDHIVPGHDPQVMVRYPAASPELEGIVARLDVPPKQTTA